MIGSGARTAALNKGTHSMPGVPFRPNHATLPKENVRWMIEFFLPNSRALLPTFRTNCPDGSHFAQMGSDLSQKTTTNPCSLQGCGSATRFRDCSTKKKIKKLALSSLSPGHVSARRSRRYITRRNTKVLPSRLHEMYVPRS